MRGAAGVADGQGAEREGVEVGDLHRTGVDHHRGVHAVERAPVQQQRLPGAALLGRCADHPDGESEPVGVGGEAERGAEAGGGDEVVAAGVAEAGQGVVLADDRDGDRSAAGARAERGGQAGGAGGDRKAVLAQQLGAPLGSPVFLERDLRVGVDAAAERQQLVPVGEDALAHGLLRRGVGRSGGDRRTGRGHARVQGGHRRLRGCQGLPTGRLLTRQYADSLG